MSLTNQSIGIIAEQFDVSAHTLRYYEKIGLLPPISKDRGGRRIYSQRDVDRLHFIKRAQRMHFSLKEIGELISLDKAQLIEKPQVQELVIEKLDDIEESLKDLKLLKKDLTAMLSACLSSTEEEQCPIIEGMKDNDQVR